ncbi:MAG TPA: HAMP domain-containing sensor histidine kinase [Niallia sp.]|nr:HAMP domain-containing sensor histidine kinase [Niallia sp.]
MATKWKNRVLFVVSVLLLTFGLSGIIPSINWVNDYATHDYFESSLFYDNLGEFTDYLSKYELNYIPIEEAKKQISVSSEEIEAYRYYYGNLSEQISNIKGQYEDRIQEAKINNNKKEEEKLTKERDTKIEDITQNFESDEYVEKKIRKEKETKLDDYYQQLQDNKASGSKRLDMFSYYFKNTTTGKVYTNVKLASSEDIEDQLQKQDMAYITEYGIGYDPQIMQTINNQLMWRWGVEESFVDEDDDSNRGYFDGYIGVPKEIAASNKMKSEMANFNQEKKVVGIYSLSALAAFILFASIIFMSWKTIRKSNLGSWYNRMPMDIRMVLLLVNVAIASFFAIVAGDQFQIYLDNEGFNMIDFVVLILIAIISMVLLGFQVIFLGSQKEKRTFREVIKSTLAYQVVKSITNWINDVLSSKSLTSRVILSIGLLLIGILIASFSSQYMEMLIILILYLLLFYVPIFFSLIKKAKDMDRIIHYSQAIVDGNEPQDIVIKRDKFLSVLTENMNSLKKGVIHSQNAQAKSERLKTELITNVSHDLRTPLTSIINYTELLKDQTLTEEVREGYLSIIDRKSQRLKVLIDDLFEVSKMVSGNIELKKEQVDLVQLLQQAMGEYNDSIQASNLDFRVSSKVESIYAIVDGQKMWRVFDNLIGNILKYSLEHTRVYISLNMEKEMAIIQFKNISKYELDDQVDELFERFKRGDTSRHTEGSGLGLAIAKSIVDLHGGTMEISTDGDLFKVTLKIKVTNQDSTI